ncbi:YrhK family protein [Limibaculum sp. M0105]|uniref:YrhK family protein n=1 Tax=Thermohalobaculum xanthum TaxID=2753746 RepID=A0A8J7M5P3_9RHOB|nr:YrhK family protein [Thermohalobaculum xanthum]MBK0398680.1 YrhK family protein [Thermohalobaculum xanthum]
MFFDPNTRGQSARHRRIYAAYEVLYTAVDFSAAAFFVVGSVLFLNEATVRTGTWLFIIGSICFAAKPSIRLIREVHFWQIGRTDILAERADD